MPDKPVVVAYGMGVDSTAMLFVSMTGAIADRQRTSSIESVPGVKSEKKSGGKVLATRKPGIKSTE